MLVGQPLETYQDEIYLTGTTGTTPGFPTDLSRLEEAARAVMTPQAYDYVVGSAGAGDTAQGESGGIPPVADRAADAHRRQHAVLRRDRARD